MRTRAKSFFDKIQNFLIALNYWNLVFILFSACTVEKKKEFQTKLMSCFAGQSYNNAVIIIYDQKKKKNRVVIALNI